MHMQVGREGVTIFSVLGTERNMQYPGLLFPRTLQSMNTAYIPMKLGGAGGSTMYFIAFSYLALCLHIKHSLPPSKLPQLGGRQDVYYWYGNIKLKKLMPRNTEQPPKATQVLRITSVSPELFPISISSCAFPIHTRLLFLS